MKVLIACEYSGTVRDEFIKKGHEAMSCDLLPTDVDGPHYQGDVFDIINQGWDMMIAFPPCTHLAVSGAAHFAKKRADGRQQEGINFFMAIVKTDIPKIAIENPVGIMSKIYRPPDQIIHPYYFGDEFQKTTCLWLKGLKPLQHQKEIDLFTDNVTHVGKGEMVKFNSGCVMPKWYADAFKLAPSERAKLRSKTFPGIAKAMANQWGNI